MSAPSPARRAGGSYIGGTVIGRPVGRPLPAGILGPAVSANPLLRSQNDGEGNGQTPRFTEAWWVLRESRTIARFYALGAFLEKRKKLVGPRQDRSTRLYYPPRTAQLRHCARRAAFAEDVTWCR